MAKEQSVPPRASYGNGRQGGHLYMQTNEIRNAIIHYRWSDGGTITEVGRIPTGGAGSGGFKPISGQAMAPNDFEGAGSVILSPDRRFLFTTNGGDNSVSSFSIGEDGELTLVDVKRTGNVVTADKRMGSIVTGMSGTAKSLAYSHSRETLYVLHAFGPDHIRLMSVDSEGRLTPRPERYSVNTDDWPNRVPTVATLSPDERFLLVGTTFDDLPTMFPDGSPNLWVHRDGGLHSIASNAPDPNGLVVFRVGEDGTLSAPSFHDAGGASPFYPIFLHNRPDHFLLAFAVSDGVAMGTINADGKVSIGPVVQIDTSAGVPSEVCWLAVSPDDRFVFVTPFGYSSVSSFHIDGETLSVAKDPACPRVPGDGTFRALNGTVSSGPSDGWLTPDGEYLYQIYGNASELVGYAVQPDGSLQEVTRAEIPYNSPQGLAGFEAAA